MRKGKLVKGTLCGLLSVLLIITLVSSFMVVSLAGTSPVSSDGVWEHGNMNSAGGAYVTMFISNMNYYFVMTQDNQEFTFAPQFNAFKNDGVNSATINSVAVQGDSSFLSSSTWNRLSSKGSDTPNGCGLPGSLGSGFDSQKNNNRCTWEAIYTFTANGPMTKNFSWLITYKSEGSSFSTKTYTTANEPINFTVAVCDMRELISIATTAQNAVNDLTYTLTQEQRDNLSSIMTEINNKNLLSGTVYCEQNEIDAYVSSLKAQLPANYYTLNTLVANYNSLNSVHYTEESWNAVQDVIDTFDYSYMFENQNIVDGYVVTLNNALSSLDEFPADFTQVNNVLTQINELDKSIYTDESWNTLQSIVDSIDFELKISNQAVVDGYVSSLNEAISALEIRPADYSKLNILVNQINTMSASHYTAETWSELQAVLSTVDYTLKYYDQETVDGYVEAVSSAMSNLVELPADYTAVNELVAQIGELNNEIYTDESWTALQNVVSSINYELLITSQDTVDGYATALETSINALVEKPADYTEVNNLVLQINELNSSIYTDETWAALQSIVTTINYDLTITSQATVNEYVVSLKKAINDLVVKPADYTAVNELVAQIGELNNEIYTDESWTALQNVVSSINYDLLITSQDTVNGYAIALESSINALVEKPADYTEVNNLISQVNELNSSIYTDETWAALQSVVTTINYDLTITSQATVDNYVVSLQSAINSLENKLCDYSNLDYALALSLNIKTENDGRYDTQAYETYLQALASAKLVESNLRLDSEGLNQKKVDDAAKVLSDAITALEQSKKPVVTITDKDGNIVSEIPVDNSTNEVVFEDIKENIQTPDVENDYAFAGWEDANGNTITDKTVITSDIELIPVIELAIIKPASTGNTIAVERQSGNSVMTGIDVDSNSVIDIINSLENENVQIIVTKNDVELNNDELIGTGCKVKCVSSKNSEVVYEEVTVILYGDINGDGKIDENDHETLKNNAFSFESEIAKDSVYFNAADIDGDGTLDGFDYWLHDLHVSGVKKVDQSLRTF